jgi:rhamnosyltransferase subunit B
LISHPLTVTLPLVAQRLELPWVSTVLLPMSFMSSFDPPVIAAVPWLQKLRKGNKRKGVNNYKEFPGK